MSLSSSPEPKLESSTQAATTIQKRVRGSCARAYAKARWESLERLQRWLRVHFMRLVVRRAFHAAERGEKDELDALVCARPPILPVQ